MSTVKEKLSVEVQPCFLSAGEKEVSDLSTGSHRFTRAEDLSCRLIHSSK